MPLDEPTSRTKPHNPTAQPETQRQTPHPQPKRGDRDENPPENHTTRIDHIDRPGRRCHSGVRAKKDLIMEKPIEDLHAAISKGDLTYEELTAFYLDRIKTYDAGEKGINAVAAINPKAIEEARTLDASSATPAGMRGIPVLVKDNVNTNTMPTSGGTYALKDFTPKDDADVVTALTNSGAIILGKSNLSELANFMDTKMPSGYSSKAGQTHNPYDPLNLSPEGSSSGSGAAVAANFSAAAIGTETTGSIIAPAAIHSIVGFKPTKDAISTAGVIPLSSTMDTVGTMAKSVKDAAVLYNASASDASKAASEQLDAGFLKGKRIGIVGDDPQQALARKIEACGAQAVPVELSEDGIDNEYIINQDFKNDLDRYLQTYQAPVKSLSDLVAFNPPASRMKAPQEGPPSSQGETRTRSCSTSPTASSRKPPHGLSPRTT